MWIGNCYMFSIQQYRRYGGAIPIRRSVKTWVPHSMWAPAFRPGADAVRITLWRGAFRIYSKAGGYLCRHSGVWWWVASLETHYLQEYEPKEWIDLSMKRSWIARTFPLHAIVFFGRVRAGYGESIRTLRAMRKRAKRN